MASDTTLLFASFGGATVRKIMEELQSRLRVSFNTEVARIQPVHNRKYWVWLLLSLIPGVGVKIRNTIIDLAPYGLIILGFPKWNLNCPPIASYIKSLVNVNEKRFLIIVTYTRGLAVDWYIENASLRIREKGGEVRGAYAVTPSQLEGDALSHLLANIQTAVNEMLTPPAR